MSIMKGEHYAREQALHGVLLALEKACREWASRSANGALIWEIATERLDSLWNEWREAAERSPQWSPGPLVAECDRIASLIADDEVGKAVERARTSLLAYRE